MCLCLTAAKQSISTLAKHKIEILTLMKRQVASRYVQTSSTHYRGTSDCLAVGRKLSTPMREKCNVGGFKNGEQGERKCDNILGCAVNQL